MSKRKNWGANCILTVLAVALFLLGTFLAEKLTAFGGRHYDYFWFFIIILICLPLLWGLLLSVRSRCYRKVIGKASDLIPEILMILLGLFTTYWITFHGMLLPFLYNYVQQYMAIFPAMFIGVALTDIAAGIGQIRKKKTEPVIQEENE